MCGACRALCVLHVLEGTGACDEPGEAEAVGQRGDKCTMKAKKPDNKKLDIAMSEYDHPDRSVFLLKVRLSAYSALADHLARALCALTMLPA